MSEIKKMLSAGIRRFICSSMQGKAVKGTEPIQLSMHETLECFFCIRGESRFLMNNKLFDIRPGDMCVIEPWVTHASGYYPDDCDLLQLWIHWNRDSLWAHFIQVSDHGSFKCVLAPFSFPSGIIDLLRTRWQSAKSCGEITDETLNKYLRLPLNLIMEEVLLALEDQKHVRTDKKVNVNTVESVKQYIMARQGSDCSLQELEKFTGYSRFYVSHLFREQTGSSIGSFINTVREKYTAEAELHGIKYKEIARQLGFSSIQAFCLWNKKHKQKIKEFKDRFRNSDMFSAAEISN